MSHQATGLGHTATGVDLARAARQPAGRGVGAVRPVRDEIRRRIGTCSTDPLLIRYA